MGRAKRSYLKIYLFLVITPKVTTKSSKAAAKIDIRSKLKKAITTSSSLKLLVKSIIVE